MGNFENDATFIKGKNASLFKNNANNLIINIVIAMKSYSIMKL